MGQKIKNPELMQKKETGNYRRIDTAKAEP
jgi:hypothetical protein